MDDELGVTPIHGNHRIYPYLSYMDLPWIYLQNMGPSVAGFPIRNISRNDLVQY